MKNRKNTGISAIIGVIFIAVITIAIAVAVFIHIEYSRENQDNIGNLYVEGQVANIYTNSTIQFENKSIAVWQVTLGGNSANNTGHMYQMIFDGPSPPQIGEKIRFFYEFYVYNDIKYFRVYDVRSI